MWRWLKVMILVVGVSAVYAAKAALPAAEAKIVLDADRKGEPWYAPGVKAGPHNIKTILLFEDFESGTMPPGWTTVDGNGDGFTWGIKSSGAWHSSAMPPDPGNYVVGYDDDEAGSNPATDEELIAPAVYTGDFPLDSALILVYGFGYNNLWGYDTFAVKVRSHDGTSWGDWQIVALYDYDIPSAWDSLDISGFLPADSIQVEFAWWDHRDSHWDWYVAVDNVLIATASPPPPPPQFFLIYEFDFNQSDQGFVHLCPPNDPKTCPEGVDDWEWGTPTCGPEPGELTCDDVPLSNCWATKLDTLYSINSCSRLVSPCIYIPDTCEIGVWLEICHWYYTETNWDGGNVVVFDPCDPYDGAPTAVLPVVDGKIYDGLINTSTSFFACLVDSEPGFTGHQYGWFKSYFDLTPYAGRDIRFGFDFGSDESICCEGWYIKWAKIWCVQPPTGIGEGRKETPAHFALLGAKPNPTRGVTQISFSIPRAADVKLAIYDAAGRLVTTLLEGKLESGTHTVTWNGLDCYGRKVSQGIYFYRLTAGEFNATRKLILIR